MKALKAQLIPGKGVKLTQSSSVTLDFTVDDQSMQVQVNTRTVGTLAFGKGSVRSADLRVAMSTRQQKADPPYRVIAEGRNAYVTNSGIARALPQGRSWVQARTSERRNPLLDLGITPADLQFMLDNSSQVAAGEYAGTATLAEFRRDKSAGEGNVEFRLYFDKRNLLTRTVIDSTTSPDDDSTAYDQMAFHTDTKYSGWGVKVKITPPAAGKVISEKKLDAKTRKAVIKAGYPESGPF
ncbi:hypothetical protein [Nonomuraea gerenzanensis]|uniref:Lipoprotein n=1 Tax=Nonomuraea gerenzanensis TaxID=93944 RepID=A0A1M4E4Q8_9ACTN|nr:hypothetical protein [Nonomuraea gerenzanensis]UBU15966.1 hypothetical protein LCN96_13435 [Nonomuraea gerenzanensis]SBO93764.1 hypothetical protein BN4615_P3278 [Nonomuraea gerenzanensis]